MNTMISLSPGAYRKAESLAKQLNLTIEETVNKVFYYEMILLPKTGLAKQEERTLRRRNAVKKLAGSWKSRGKTMKSYKDLRDEYLQEKYGV